MGVPITNVNQANNTFSVNESLSKVLGSHTIKGGCRSELRAGKRDSQCDI